MGNIKIELQGFSSEIWEELASEWSVFLGNLSREIKIRMHGFPGKYVNKVIYH